MEVRLITNDLHFFNISSSAPTYVLQSFTVHTNRCLPLLTILLSLDHGAIVSYSPITIQVKIPVKISTPNQSSSLTIPLLISPLEECILKLKLLFEFYNI